MPDEPVNGEQEDELFIQGQSLNLEESAPPTPRQQEDRPKILTPSDEEELQDLWDLSTSIPVGATSSSSGKDKLKLYIFFPQCEIVKPLRYPLLTCRI